MPEPVKTAIQLVAFMFALAAVWIATAQVFGRLRGRRIWTTWGIEFLLVAWVFGPAFLGRPWFTAAIALTGIACAYELLKGLERAGERPDRFLSLLGVVLALGFTGTYSMAAGQTAVALTATLVMARSVFPGPQARSTSLMGATLLVIVYPGVFFSYLIALGSTPTGFADVFFCYAIVELNDALSYLIGATFGGPRIFPNLSPNKTLVGCVGGIASTVALSPLFHFALPELSSAQLLTAAFLLAIFGVVGDLLASSLKRGAVIKDFGGWVPTHGGVLDVYDSLIFVSPVFHTYLAYCRAR